MTITTRLALGADPDNVRVATLLRRAHTIAMDTGVAPRAVREVVQDSWRRSAAAGVDPRRPASRVLDARQTAERLAKHPLASALTRIGELLRRTTAESGYFAAFSDAEGVLLWSDGPARALERAVAPRFLPGFDCREDGIGTNALGTALVLDHPVQIFSAEHFNQMLHGWSCAAAPVHDPDSGHLLGALDLSGLFRTAHVHSLGLVTALALVLEGGLSSERRAADARLVALYRERWGSGSPGFTAVVTASGRVVSSDPPGCFGARIAVTGHSDRWLQPDGSTVCAEPLGTGYVVWRTAASRPAVDVRVHVRILGQDRAKVQVDGRQVELSSRHSEIVALLALDPGGATVRSLATQLYGAAGSHATVRAEMARLRPILGNHLRSRPYRLGDGVQVDVAIVERHLSGGRRQAARRLYAGPLLPASTAPGVVAARKRIASALNGVSATSPSR